ncbi:MAG TPA: hypothetical protein VGL77_08830 [Armatimonadota bacterium]|jgi:hypothetical protein
MADRQDGLTGEEYSLRRMPRGQRVRRWCLFLLGLFLVLVIIGYLVAGRLYTGPQTLTAVVRTMPHVPLFPLIEIAPDNRQAQRALAFPLWLMRWQGATRAEAAQLRAPADADFIQEWYQRVAPSQGWCYQGCETLRMGTRLLYLRRNEGLQILVGHTSANIYTPVQLIYLQGLTAAQVEQLAATLRIPRRRQSPIGTRSKKSVPPLSPLNPLPQSRWPRPKK